MKPDHPAVVIERCTINQDAEQAAQIAGQNDQFRRELLRPDKTVPGHVLLTRGVTARGQDFVTAAKLAVASYSSSWSHRDPHSERDFGTIEIMGERMFWLIDLCDIKEAEPPTDRADMARTTRILKIMFASEYR